MAVGQGARDVAVDLSPSSPTYEPSSPTPTYTEVEASMALPPPGLDLPPPVLQAVPGPSSQAASTGDGSASTGAACRSVETLRNSPPPGLQAVSEEAGGIDIVAVEAGIAAIYGAGPKVKGVGEAGGSDCYLSSMAESDSRGDGQQADAQTTATCRDVPMELSLAGAKVVVAAPLPAESFAGTLLDVLAPEFALVAKTAIEEGQPPPMWNAPPAKHVPLPLVAAVIHPKAQSSATADDGASAAADDEAEISLTATGQDIFGRDKPPRVPAHRGQHKPPPAALDTARPRPCNLILSQPKAKHQRVDPNPPPRVDAKPAAIWFAMPPPQATPPIAPPQATPPTETPQATPPTTRARSRYPWTVHPWRRRNRGNPSADPDDSTQENEGRARTRSC